MNTGPRIRRSNSLHHYRGYVCIQNIKEGFIRCKYQLKHCNFHMPRSFKWLDAHNFTGLHEYIDQLIAKNNVETKKVEEQGFISEAEYDHPPVDVPVIRINKERLMAILRGEDTLDVPASSRIVFANETNRSFPIDVWAEVLNEELVPLWVETLRKRAASGRPIAVVTGSLGPFKDADFEQLTSGHNLEAWDHANSVSASEDDGHSDESPEPVEEVHLFTNDHGTYQEVVSLISSPGKVPFFVRRLIRKGALLWCGTSYHAKGPWTVYHTNESSLLALGITP